MTEHNLKNALNQTNWSIDSPISDFQILPFEMSQSIQEAKESTQDKMDQSVP